MCEVIEFRRHADALASAGDERARKRSNASNVMCAWPLRFANRTIDGQRPGGMPRSRHRLTVPLDNASSEDTVPVPPRSSMTESLVSRIGGHLVCNLQTSQEFPNCRPTFAPEPAPIWSMADALKEQARRLKVTREALGFATQQEFCNEIGISKITYNPFEKGRRPITLAVAMKIKRRFKIGLDWTFDGDPDDLPGHLFRKLARTAA